MLIRIIMLHGLVSFIGIGSLAAQIADDQPPATPSPIKRNELVETQSQWRVPSPSLLELIEFMTQGAGDSAGQAVRPNTYEQTGASYEVHQKIHRIRLDSLLNYLALWEITGYRDLDDQTKGDLSQRFAMVILDPRNEYRQTRDLGKHYNRLKLGPNDILFQFYSRMLYATRVDSTIDLTIEKESPPPLAAETNDQVSIRLPPLHYDLPQRSQQLTE